MKKLLVFALFLSALALGQRSSAPQINVPKDFVPVKGTVYLVLSAPMSLPEDVRALLVETLDADGTQLRVLVDLRGSSVQAAYNLVRLLKLPAKTKVVLRTYRGYPPIFPLLLAPNWLYMSPSRFSDNLQEVGSYWKVVESAWANASTVP